MLSRLNFARQRLVVCSVRPIFLQWYTSNGSINSGTGIGIAWTNKQKRKLFDRVNQQKELGSLSWDELSTTYNISVNSLQDIYTQVTNRVKLETETREKVCRSAQQNYDKVTGRVDWDKVSHEVGIPVSKCLLWFSYEQTSIRPKERTEKIEWSKEELSDMKQFIKKNFDKGSAIVWSDVAKYINVNMIDCMNALRRKSDYRWTDEEIQKIKGYLKSGCKWRKIKEKLKIPVSIQKCKNAYHSYMMKRDVADDSYTSFTPKELKQMKVLFNQNLAYKYNDPELIDRVAAKLHGKAREDVEDALGRIHNNHMHVFFGYKTLVVLFDLVKTYGQDWAKIGEIMSKHPIIVENNWNINKDKFDDSTKKWTEDELRILVTCFKNGMSLKKTAMAIPTKLQSQCYDRIRQLKKESQ